MALSEIKSLTKWQGAVRCALMKTQYFVSQITGTQSQHETQVCYETLTQLWTKFQTLLEVTEEQEY